MSLFIAILDDNPADRKQSERLLSRERDVRKLKDEVIYFDSYGSRDALLPCCMKYDLILIDVVNSAQDGFMAAAELKQNRAEAQMVLAASKIDYKAKYGDYSDFIFIDKPLLQKHFSYLVDLAKEHKKKQVKRIELRDRENTIHAREDDILYMRRQSYYTIVALKDDKTFHAQETIDSLLPVLDPCIFLSTDENTVINMQHVISRKKNTFTMSDGAVIKFSIFHKSRILKSWEKYALSRL